MKSRGFSIVEVLIVAGITSVIFLSIMTLMNSQQRQVQALSQKQDMIDLKNQMLLQLSNPSVCNWQLKDKVINVSMATTEASPSPTVLALSNNTIYAGSDVTSAPLATAGQRLPASLTNLQVAQVSFKNIYATGVADQYKGVFEIVFNSNSLAFAMKPVQVQQIIRTVASDPPNAKRIDSCETPQSTGALSNIQVFDTPGNHPFTVPANVTTLQVEVWGGGGGGCGGNGGAGGGGGYSLCTLSVAPGANYTATVGDKGAAAGNNPGCAVNDGENSVFSGSGGPICIAMGGRAGSAGVGGGEPGITVAGPGILGFMNLRGGNGADLGNCPGSHIDGRGGSSPRGGDGGISSSPAGAPGGGGGAACWNGVGFSGDGAPGAIHIRW